MRIALVQIEPDLPAPSSALPGDAGLDLRSRSRGLVGPNGGKATFPTGFAVAIPSGFVGLVIPRSGLAADSGITVLNAPGVIDSGYRGEVNVILVNHGRVDFVVDRGDRVAQLLILAVPDLEVEVVEALPTSERGSQGLGHSGVK